MTTRDRNQDAHQEAPPVPWHNRTSALLGASVAAAAAIAIVVTSISYVSRQFSEPEQAPINYVEPAFSDTDTDTDTTQSSTSTTTATVTSTSPPVTSDINPDLTPPSTTDSSEPSSSRNPALRPPRTRDEEPDDDSTTTRKRPRTNVTRTLYPAP